ncbi:50S ribosomal protein L25 [Candidatus Saccharibacteria bacterium CPR2]|nr:50S ribosomal protein L25 [Candidatus Saccharibacteria bacterium CPR2]
MTDIKLQLVERKKTGKAGKKELEINMVPGVIYGKEFGPTHVAADYNKLQKVFHEAGKTHVVAVDIEGKTSQRTMFKAVQSDPAKNQIRHFDLLAVKKGEKVHADIPIVLVGEAPAGRSNIINQVTESVPVEGEPDNLPDQFEVNIEDLNQIGDHIILSQIKIPKELTLLIEEDPATVTVVKVDPPIKEEEPVEAEAQTEIEGAEDSSEQAGSDASEEE